MSAPALSLSGVSCTFVDRHDAAQRYTAVRDVTLTVGAGEFVSVVGPTGCGKSTLLNVGAGLLAPSTGTVQVFGRPLQGINTRAGYMFQAESLMPWRTALGNVMAGLEFRGVPGAKEQAEEWLRRVGLGGFGDRYPHQLSGGMRKRTSLAQTLALDPDIILMDEPFSALDIQTRQLMENEVLALWAAKKKAVLFITHDLDEAIAMSDRVVVGVVTKIVPKGLPDAQSIRSTIESQVKLSKKAEIIKAKLTATPTLETAAAAYGGAVATAGADSMLVFTANIINGIGQEPKVIGASFNKAYQAKASEPIEGNSGVYVIKVNSYGTKNVDVPANDKTKQLAQQFSYGWMESLKKLAKVDDERSSHF